MDDAVSGMGESAPTPLATEWLLSCVDSAMGIEVGAPGKSLPTKLTHEWAFTSMGIHVQLQFIAALIALIT